jgi:ABC-2 type transport system permease protein
MFKLFIGEYKRTWLMFKHYPSEAIAIIFILTALFYGLILGIYYVAGTNLSFGDRLDSLVVGYVLWTLVALTVGDFPRTIQNEAQTGFIEQLFLSPFSASKIYLVRACANMTLNLVLIFGVLLMTLAITKSKIQFSFSLLLPLVTVIIAAIGLGFAMGALALLFKRVHRITSIFEFSLLFLLTTPVETWRGLAGILGQLLPMTPGMVMLRAMMVRGELLNPLQFFLAVINGVAYFALGILLFQAVERYTKERGILSTH